MKRACGACTLCCKLPSSWEVGTRPDGERYEFVKPAMQWCPDCQIGRGCAIYNQPTKPHACRVFSCLWLQGFGRDEDRPDRAHVVATIEVYYDELQLVLYQDRADAAFTDAVRALVNAVLQAQGQGIRAVMAVPPDLTAHRYQWHFVHGRRWIARMPDGPNNLPPEPADADDERRRIDRVMGEGASDAPTIDTDALSEAIVASGLTYDEA